MTRLTMLMDNKALPDFEAEWGLSVAVHLDNEHLWLWDCGASGKFLDNATKLGIDVLKAKGLAISHGHWDHAGGLDALAKAGFNAPIFMHPAGLEKRWRIKKDTPPKEIGIPGTLPTITPVTTIFQLDQGLRMITEIPRAPDRYEAVNGFSLDPKGKYPDTVQDDGLLLIQEPGRTTVLLGCCHSGLYNSLHYLRKELGVQRIHTLVGGLHLFDCNDETPLAETVLALNDFAVECVLTGHCTGDNGLEYLRKKVNIPVEETRTGMRIKC